MSWKGIVGKPFRPDEFRNYVSDLTFSGWRPQFTVVHNTSSPRLSQWHSVPGATRMRNLESYYRDEQGWSAGPHLFIADDFIWVFTPLTTSGVHSPSWNGVAWGVEMVGEYEVEPFSPAVRENTVDALAILHQCRGLDPQSIRFHKDDPKTTHKTCPGRNVDKGDLIRRVQARMKDANVGEHFPNRITESVRAVPSMTMSAPSCAGPAAGEGRFTNIAATEFGGGSEDGMDSAYGGKVDPSQPQAALPAKLAANRRRVRVFHVPSGKELICTVNDIGPWNTSDRYWQTNSRPQAEAQFRNRTAAENGRVPTNDAGIDLTPAVFDVFGVKGPVNTRQMHVDWEFA